MAKLKTGFLCLLKHYEVVWCEGVWLEVIVTSVSKLVDFTYLKDVSNLLIYRGEIVHLLSTMDMPVPSQSLTESEIPRTLGKNPSNDFCIRAVFFIGGLKKNRSFHCILICSSWLNLKLLSGMEILKPYF